MDKPSDEHCIINIEQTTGNGKEKLRSFKDISRDPEVPIDAQLYSGVLLDGENKMLYWVDRKTNKNCFKLFPRGLEVINNEKIYWEWEEKPLEEKSDQYIEIARLIKVCWLQVTGKFDISKLSSKTWYIVLFELKLNEKVDEWPGWSTMKLTLPKYKNMRVNREHKVNMKVQEKGKWIEVPVGVFNTSIFKDDKIDFFMHHYSDYWIEGIEIKCVKIQPLDAIST